MRIRHNQHQNHNVQAQRRPVQNQKVQQLINSLPTNVNTVENATTQRPQVSSHLQQQLLANGIDVTGKGPISTSTSTVDATRFFQPTIHTATVRPPSNRPSAWAAALNLQ